MSNPFLSHDNSISFLLSRASLRAQNSAPDDAALCFRDVSATTVQSLCESADIIESRGFFTLNPTLLSNITDELTRALFESTGASSDSLLTRHNRDLATYMIREKSKLAKMTGRLKAPPSITCNVCEQERKDCRVCCGRAYCSSCMRTVAKRCYTCGAAVNYRSRRPSINGGNISLTVLSERPHEFWMKKMNTFRESLLNSGEELEAEVEHNPAVAKGMSNLVALQNRDQRVIATSAKSWTDTVHNFFFKRWAMCMKAEKKSRARMIKMLTQKKAPKLKNFFVAWRSTKDSSKLKKVTKETQTLINLADKTRDNVRECMARERDSRELNFQSKAVLTSLVRSSKEATKLLESPLTSGIALGSVLATLATSFVTLGNLCERQMQSSMDVSSFSNLKLGKPFDNAMRGMSTTLQAKMLKFIPRESNDLLEALNNIDLSDFGAIKLGIVVSDEDESDEGESDEGGESGEEDESGAEGESGEEGGESEEEEDSDGSDGSKSVQDEQKENKRSGKRSPRTTSSTNAFRFERNENDPKYWPDTFDFPAHHDFQKKIQEQYWDWSDYRTEEIKALTHTTAAGQALCHFAQLHVNQENGSSKVNLSAREQEDRAARKFQSLWRARQARMDWKNNKENVLAQAMLEREEDDAARIFQAQWRGRKARQEWKLNPTAVIERKFARDEQERLAKIQKAHQKAEYNSLEYACGIGDKAYGAGTLMTGIGDKAVELVGVWRFNMMKSAASKAAMILDDDEQLLTNYCSGGTKNQGYLGHDAAKVLGKSRKLKGMMAKRMEFMSATQRGPYFYILFSGLMCVCVVIFYYF